MVDSFTDIQGRHLSAVVFVQDYLQLQFDGITLTMTSWPSVTGRSELRVGDPGYRDALCTCIAKVVKMAELVERDHLQIVFDDDSTIRLSLKDSDRVDPEAVRIDYEDGRWSVW